MKMGIVVFYYLLEALIWYAVYRHFGVLDASAFVAALWLLMPFQPGRR